MKQIAWIAVLAACVAAPAWSGSFDAKDTLNPGEGILLTNMTCGGPVGGVQVFAEGTSSAGFFGPLKADGSLHCAGGFRTIRLKSGRYYVGQLYSATDNSPVPPDKSPHFSIEAGKLNYVGDLYAGGPISEPLDDETQMRVMGRVLTLLNHEPQMRERLAKPEHAWLAGYEFVTDKSLGPIVPIGAMPSPNSRQMQVTMQIGKPRWKRGEDGQPIVCRRLLPLPEGATAVPGEPRPCDGEFITPAQLVAEEYGASATLRRVEVLDGDDGALTLAATAIPPGLKDTERRQLEVPAGQWWDGRQGKVVCYDSATTDTVNITDVSGTCPKKAISPREYLRRKLGKEVRFVSSTRVGPDGGLLRIDYDIDVPVQ
jgi:hypothetical protein